MQFHRSLFVGILTVLLGFATVSTLSAQDAKAGKALFKAKCATCHSANMKTDATGPALGGVQERWADFPQEDLYSWIQNSQALVATGHPRATKLFKDWNGSVMNSFTELSTDDIDNILVYIDNMYVEGCAEPPCDNLPPPPGSPGSESTSYTWLFLALLVAMLGVLALVLARILGNLNNLTVEKETGEPAPRRTLLDMLTSRNVLAFLIFGLVVIGAYFTVNNAIAINRQQGYQPEQPIKFSHATHAGVNKIDCQYCHDGARRSKHSVIPAVNTCMNCHTAIKQGPSYGKSEIAKIYASAGYDPRTGKGYIDDYTEISKDSVRAIFFAWMAEDLLKENAELTEEELDDMIGKEVDNLVDNYAQKPIEWVKIHNLQDHAYFNHAQHVTVGEVECQTCHGPVEEMEVVYQYSPLSMGWCINCHRQSEVQFTDNEYYTAFDKYHQDLKEGKIDKVTVEDIGGLECQKCHY